MTTHKIECHDEDGKTVVATGLTKEEAEQRKEQEEAELEGATGMTGDFRIVQED